MHYLKRTTFPFLLASSLSVLSFPVVGLDTGDVLVRGRIININPDSSSDDVTANGKTVANTAVDVGSATTLDIDFTYMLGPNLGVELLLDTSSKHDISSKGATLAKLAPGDIISTRVLPPALILQYHLTPQNQFRPYAGLGVNFTYFFDEEATSSLNSGLGGVSGVSLDSSFGWVAQVGVDYDMPNDWFLNFDIKYMGISTKAEFSSGKLGNVSVDVDINPWVIGFGIGKYLRL